MWLYSYFNMPTPPRGESRKMFRKLAQWESDTAYQELFVYLTNMWLDRFQWEGLPDTCNERALEMTLFFHGKALFFRDDEIFNPTEFPVVSDSAEGHYFHTPCVLAQGFNIYYEHIKRRAYSYNYNKQFDISNSVLIRNNQLMYPTLPSIMYYAQKLMESQRNIDVISDHLNFPFIICCDESELKSWESFELMRREHNIQIFVTKSLNLDSFKILPTNVRPELIIDAWENLHNWQNEVFTRFGLNNANTDKRERLIAAEVESNNELIKASIDTMLLSRQKAADLINDMFGLSISVKLRSEVRKENERDLYDDAMGLPRSEEPPL